MSWRSIDKIGLSRSYLDGHVSELRIHHTSGISKIPVQRLHEGEKVVRVVLAMFARTNQAQTLKRRAEANAARGLQTGSTPRATPTRAHFARAAPRGSAEGFANEFAMLRKALAGRPLKFGQPPQRERELT